MNSKEFDQQLEALRECFAALLLSTEESPISSQELLKLVSEELHIPLAELQVAEEQLCQQNQELEISRLAVEAERQRAEVERQRYQDLFEEAPDGYLVTDTSGTIQAANRAAGILLGAPVQQSLLGQSLLGFVAQEERQSFHSQLIQLCKGDWVRSLEVRLMLRQRRFVDVALTVAIVHNQECQPIALRWLLRDMTERKLAEQALTLFHHSRQKKNGNPGLTQ